MACAAVSPFIPLPTRAGQADETGSRSHPCSRTPANKSIRASARTPVANPCTLPPIPMARFKGREPERDPTRPRSATSTQYKAARGMRSAGGPVFPAGIGWAWMIGGVGSLPKPVSPKSLAPARKQEQAWISASHRAVRRKQEARAYKSVARAAHRNTTLAWPRTAAGRAMSTNLGATAMPGRKRMDECKQVARLEMRALTRAGTDQRRANAAADKLEHE